jgi:hypothetical protein
MRRIVTNGIQESRHRALAAEQNVIRGIVRVRRAWNLLDAPRQGVEMIELLNEATATALTLEDFADARLNTENG